MSQRAEQKAESRSAIVRAAAGLLRESGTGGMSVERAMKGAGLTVGAFYAHFADKDELLATSFAHAIEELAKNFFDEAAARGAGRGALLDVIGRYLSEYHRDNARVGCPLPSVGADAATHGTRSISSMFAAGLGTMAERLTKLGGAAIGRDDALAIAVVMVGGQVLARATRGTPLSNKILSVARETARGLVEAKRRS